MKVLLYTGGRELVGRSGVGSALAHQERALALADVDFTENPREDYDVIHVNTVLPDARWMAVRARRAPWRISGIPFRAPMRRQGCFADGLKNAIPARIW